MMLSIAGRSQSGRLFTTESELSSSLINDVHQDAKGYIWIATEDGLNRYDGAKFTIYKSNKNDSTSILNNYVQTIFEDSNNNLFLGFHNGLQLYDYARDSFREIPLILPNNTKFDAHVTSMLERKNGDLLIATSGQGVFSLDMNNQKLLAHRIKGIVPSDYIADLYEDHIGNLWVVTQDKGLFQINSANKSQHFFYEGELEFDVSSICEDQRGNLYVGTFNQGLFHYDRPQNLFKSLHQSLNLPVTALRGYKENKILIGTDGIGLKVYDPVSKNITISNFSISNFDFSKSKVHTIMEDRSGNLWLGLYQKGIMIIPAKTNNFNYIGFQSVKNNIIGSNSVSSLQKGHNGVLWVGTDGDGVYSVSSSNKKKHHYEKINPDSQNPSSVMSIYEDSNNDLWVGTYRNGMAKLDRREGHFNRIEGFLDDQSNPVERIYSIVEDDNKHLWIGTMGSGLYSLDLDTQQIKDRNSFANHERYDELNNKWINCLLFSKQNKLYIGSYDGLSSLDLKTKSYLDEKGINHILGGKIIYCLYEDPKGNLWIGSSEGLFYKPKGQENFSTYTMKDGLPSNVVCAIEADQNNNLWISTNHGIAKFDINSKNFINYYFNDGLQGNEFSKNTSYTSVDHQILFGGINGVTYFHPNEITDPGEKPILNITGFYLRDKSVKKGMKSGNYDIIDKAVIEADTFQLSHNDNGFSLEFSSMEYNNPQRITYLYSMGDNKEWISLRQGVNTVTFNHLSPGEYTFRVKAKDYGEYSDTRTITIIIHPAWYFSTWAKCVYALIFLFIIYIIVQQARQRQINRKKIREHLQAEQINEAKLQFLTNIAHDIKTPISLITNPLKELISNENGTDRQKSYRIMHRNSERILHLIDQLMDARKIDKGQISLNYRKTELVEFIEEICLLFEDQIQGKQIHFNFYHGIPELFAWIDPKHFDKIIQNVLSNAIKFAPKGGNVTINLEVESINEKPFFHIIISDDGIGINENDLERIFERFYQVPNPETRQNEGTGIGLHLTRSIAELHHGTIRAENYKQSHGCQFIITIPLGKEHLNEDEIITEENPAAVNDVHEISPALSLEDRSLQKTAKGRYKILVVDDDFEIRKYISDELASHYKIINSSNGKEALQIVLNQHPDLIVSDVMMPKMNGITFCRKLKKNINVNHIPIILLTAKSGEKDNLEGLNIGADSYISKPFNIKILKKTVQNLIRNRELLKNTYSGNQSQESRIKKIKLKSSDEKLLQKIMDYVNENASNPTLSVEMIAKEIGISRVHLYRKLKELTNQSASDLIRNVRLKQAGELLVSKHISISEVAYATGFSNTSKFSTNFKDFYGISPTAYSKKS